MIFQEYHMISKDLCNLLQFCSCEAYLWSSLLPTLPQERTRHFMIACPLFCNQPISFIFQAYLKCFVIYFLVLSVRINTKNYTVYIKRCLKLCLNKKNKLSFCQKKRNFSNPLFLLSFLLCRMIFILERIA